MGRRSVFDTLPPELLEELRQRLIDSGFTEYQSHAGWLAEKGYPVSKSSVIRFGRSIEIVPDIELRLRCAGIAARYSTADTIIDNTRNLMRWISPPMRPR